VLRHGTACAHLSLLLCHVLLVGLGLGVLSLDLGLGVLQCHVLLVGLGLGLGLGLLSLELGLGVLHCHVLLVEGLGLGVSLGLGLLSLYLRVRHVHVGGRNAAGDGDSDWPLLTGGLLRQLSMGRLLGGVDSALTLVGARSQYQWENTRVLFLNTVLGSVGLCDLRLVVDRFPTLKADIYSS
jgi:hypothetical protein